MKYCDFIVWSPNENLMIVLRILPNKHFIDSAIEKATRFFKTGLLPELISKWVSRNQLHSASSRTCASEPEEIDSEKWCYCQSEEHGTMIGCDHEGCSIGWFHIECLELTEIPSGKWYCPNCEDLYMS